MVGAILHAIQDYCAHSYIGSADTYKKKYKQNVLKGNKKTKFSNKSFANFCVYHFANFPKTENVGIEPTYRRL